MKLRELAQKATPVTMLIDALIKMGCVYSATMSCRGQEVWCARCLALDAVGEL